MISFFLFRIFSLNNADILLAIFSPLFTVAWLLYLIGLRTARNNITAEKINLKSDWFHFVLFLNVVIFSAFVFVSTTSVYKFSTSAMTIFGTVLLFGLGIIWYVVHIRVIKFKPEYSHDSANLISPILMYPFIQILILFSNIVFVAIDNDIVTKILVVLPAVLLTLMLTYLPRKLFYIVLNKNFSAGRLALFLLVDYFIKAFSYF